MKTSKDKDPEAVSLGKKSWAKRKNNPDIIKQLSEAGRLGAIKTKAIRAAKKALAAKVDNIAIPRRGSANA